MRTTKVQRLYSVLKGYEKDVNDLSDRVAFLGQDLHYLLEELQGIIDNEGNDNE